MKMSQIKLFTPRCSKVVILAFLLVFQLNSFAQKLELASIFGDNMVLQQGMNVPVWGKSAPNSTVKIDFAGFVYATKADALGKWMVKIPLLDYGGPFTMNVSSEDTIVFQNVMVGEVWLASGQSNMEYQMKNGVGPNTKEVIENADFPEIRYFNVPRETSVVPLQNTSASSWQSITPESVKESSAVAYFFARALHQDKNIAVGIINSSWGATSVEAWISAEMLKTHPDFVNEVKAQNKNQETWKAYVEQSWRNDASRDSIAQASTNGLDMGVHTLKYQPTDWKHVAYPVDFGKAGLSGLWGVVWFRKNFELDRDDIAKENTLSIYIRARKASLYVNGTEVETKENIDGQLAIEVPRKVLQKGKNVLAIRLYCHWGSGLIGKDNSEVSLNKAVSLSGEWLFNSTIETKLPQWQDYYTQLSVQYNGRIAPIIPYGIKGVIWYQGEANVGRAQQYQSLFPLLISDWRVRWQEGYFPFLFVQLANYGQKQTEPEESSWAELREAQTETLKYPKTGMACIIDIGEASDIHPKNKMDVGKRLYLAARKVAYGENIVSSGPTFELMEVDGNKVKIHFSSTGKGLEFRNENLPSGFAIAGEGHAFVWAKARIIDNETIEIWSPEVEHPVAVRYAWGDNPDANLYNKEGLPAVPFRTNGSE